jgi:WD40 repeat protein/serine/threonine protein kinase
MEDASPEMLSIFAGAIERPAPGERAAFLDTACGADVELRRRIEALLRAHDEAGGFLRDRPGASDPGATVDQPTGEGPGGVVGPYKLLEQIGEGGFGVVFMAEQTRPVRRKVALKVLKPGMDSKQVVARFEAERQALALMDHPHIAKVHDAGTTETGRPYFVMELVKGFPITEFCDGSHLPVRERLELFAHVCQAVQHAHQKGVIHRDIKPSNVLVTLHDGVPVVKVIDFGVAKAMGQQLTDRTLFTGFAQLVGTPLYMSPEQAELSGLDVDTRTDIYALGVLLYELLTGTTPFDKDRFRHAGYDEIRRIIREEEPASPSMRISTLGQAAVTISASRRTDPQGLRRQCRKELDWIVMRCLEKDRNRRYETASALAADARRYLSDEPVQACPPSAWYRFRKLARRNRRALITVSVLALAALVGVGALAVSTVLVWKANQDVWKANQDLKESVDRERREAYFQRITVAHRELSTNNLAAALRALRDCPEDLRGWEWHYLMRLCKVEPLIIRDRTEVNGVAFSPDGERLASAGGDGVVRIWNSRTGKRILMFPAHDKAACSVVFHPDGKHLASAGTDGWVKVWDLGTHQVVFRGPCDALRKFGAAYTVAFNPADGRHLAAGSEREVRVWDWKKNRPQVPEHTFPGPEYHSIPVAFTRDGGRLATGGDGPQGLSLWDAETGRLLGTLSEPRHPVSALAFSTDGGRLASASLGRSVSLWDTATGALLQSLPHTGNVLGVAFSPDGRRLASAGEDKTVHVWDAATGREVLGLHGHTDMCGCVAFSPDGWRLSSASHDGTIRVWDATPLRVDEGQETLTFTQHDHEVRSVAVSPDGRWVASAGNGTLVRVWDAATGRVSFDFAGHSVLVFSVVWHPDGRRIATAGSVGRQHAVKVWDASDGRVHFKISNGRDSSAGPYQAVAFSPDGRYLVTGQLEGAVQVWDARTGQPVKALDARNGLKSDTFATHDREIRGVVFSRDGRHLVSASGDGAVKLWDATRLAEKQEPRLTLRARVPGPGVNVAFSPDGRRLATVVEGNTVKIWDVEKGGEPLTTLRGHSKEVYAVAFSPDDEGRWVASGGEDGKVKIWDSRSGELVFTFHGHTGLVSSLAFSPDGKRLYSGSRDTTVKAWDLTQLGQGPER